MKINNLSALLREKQRLNDDAALKMNVIQNDIDQIKKQFTLAELVKRVAVSVVPEVIRHSRLVNGPINFIARTLFKEPENVVSAASDSGKANEIRNVALGVLETAASFLMTKYIRKKF
jgi:hypothetical protein